MLSGPKTIASPFLAGCALLAILFLGFTVETSPAFGWQDDGAAAADAPADNAAAPAPAANAEPGAAVPAQSQSVWSWVYQALGIGYIVIFMILSFTLVAFFIMNFLSSRRGTICPPALADSFEQSLDEKQYQEAYEMAKADESFLGNVLAAGMARLQSGYTKSIESMQEVGEDEAMKLEHRLSYMDLIARIAPMVGLFGTVHGMINAFQKIAESGGTPEPTRLAMDIATALVTTLLGLAIAIPAMVAFTVLRNHTHRLILEVGMTAEELMSRFENVSTEKK